jgi:hypothetical protein
MPNSGVNSWGPFTTSAAGDITPTYAPTATPSKPATPPQSPSGSVTGQAATWNYTNTETSTHYFLDNVLNVDSAQQGTNAISNLLSITSSFAGIDPKTIAVNNYAAGSYGTTGNKFS